MKKDLTVEREENICKESILEKETVLFDYDDDYDNDEIFSEKKQENKIVNKLIVL